MWLFRPIFPHTYRESQCVSLRIPSTFRCDVFEIITASRRSILKTDSHPVANISSSLEQVYMQVRRNECPLWIDFQSKWLYWTRRSCEFSLTCSVVQLYCPIIDYFFGLSRLSQVCDFASCNVLLSHCGIITHVILSLELTLWAVTYNIRLNTV